MDMARVLSMVMVKFGMTVGDGFSFERQEDRLILATREPGQVEYARQTSRYYHI